MADYYVYLLVDAEDSEDPGEVFYVGKGRGTRAAHHLLEYLQAVQEGRDGQAALRQAGADPDQAQLSDDDAACAAVAEESEKVARIRAAHEAGREVRIDFLRTGLSNDGAYDVEAAVIDAIGLNKLANKVHGHHHERVPVMAAMKVLNADDVDIVDPGFLVSISGVWGGGNPLAGLLGASSEAVWENARQSWAVGEDRRKDIRKAAASKPLILVAVAKGRRSLQGGIVLGVWEIVDTDEASDRPGPNGARVKGWAFVEAPESDRVKALREKYVGKRSTTRPQPGPVAVGTGTS
ncbi:GIY-YIG nuclease family protein [Nocardioidaceae bacterium]|nr:GIY-YIG nuclease family protein [Nocardioidaceae bacterium]